MGLLEICDWVYGGIFSKQIGNGDIPLKNVGMGI